MPMTKIDWPSTGAADWTDAIDIWKDWITGLIRLSVTNYDAAGAPAIEAGSLCEIGGSYFYAASNQTPTGTPTTDDINYIYIEDDGDVKYSNTDPTWNAAMQAWMNGTDRAVLAFWFDGTNYYCKTIMRTQDNFVEEVTYNVPLCGYSTDPVGIQLKGRRIQFISILNDEGYIGLDDFKPGDYVRQLNAYCSAHTANSVEIDLRYSTHTSSAETLMASCSPNATGQFTDSSITDPLIDLENRCYWIEADALLFSTTLDISGVSIDLVRRYRSD